MFQIHALPAAEFQPLFGLSDEELAKRLARRIIADSNPGYPCRVSLADAEIGETLILLNYEHQPADSPYRASHAIFVREHAEQAFPEIGEIPEALSARLISVRAFDADDCLVASDVAQGSRLGEAIPAMFDDRDVVYLHLHNAKAGCFAARVTRA
jgi:hypothetical protein